MRIEQVAIPAIRQVMQRPRLADFLFRFDTWGNAMSPEVIADPYPTYERMRADGRVVHRKMYQQWFITGYDEARTALSSDAFSTSNQVDVLLQVRPYSKMSTQAREFFALWMLLVDPPVHTRLRRLVNRAFTPKRIAAIEGRVCALVDEQIGAMVGRDQVDVMATLARDLPVAVIADLLGLPRDMWEWSRQSTAEMIKMVNPMEYFDPDAMSASIADIHERWGALADERIANPQDDLLTALAQAEEDGDRLTRQELVAVIAFLMGAGHETTTNMLGNAIIALEQNPQQRRLLQENPDLWPNAIEELLRFDTAVKLSPRAANRDVEIGGKTIPAGQNVAVQIAAANRDPRRFDAPNELRVDRDDPSPISFGHGSHHCLGASLARMELRIGLSKFVDAFGDYTVDAASTIWKSSLTLRGPKRLIVRPQKSTIAV